MSYSEEYGNEFDEIDIPEIVYLKNKYGKLLPINTVDYIKEFTRNRRFTKGADDLEMISLDSIGEDSIDIDSTGYDPIGEDPRREVFVEHVRDLIYNEYKDKYSEKTNSAICALLNTGGHYSILIDINSIVIQLREEIESYDLPSKSKRLLNNVEWVDIIADECCKAIHYDNIIQGELLKKMWVSFADRNDENENPNRINSIINDALKSLDVSFDVNGSTLALELYVEKPAFSDWFFCLRKRSRKTNKNEKGIDSKLTHGFLYEYYFLVSDKVVKTDGSHLRYCKIVSRNPELPTFKKYEPSDTHLRKEFDEITNRNNVVFEVIGELNSSNALYKYMDLESALLCLEKRVKGSKVEKKPNLRFVEPTSWDDQYEGRFYNACYKQLDGRGIMVGVDPKEAPFLYACCFSSKRENEAAWVLYSHNRTGLASRCVEFKLNRVKLREQLVKNLNSCSVYIGPVRYFNKEKIDCVHEKIGKFNQPNDDYDKYFRPFIKECYLNLLLMKRSVFEHEKEVRVFIVPNDGLGTEKTRRGLDGRFPENVKPKAKYVDIDWTEVIEEVKIDKNCTEFEINLLQERLNKMAQAKKKEKGLDKESYENLIAKFQLKKFNPYKDESLADGPLTIVTNQ